MSIVVNGLLTSYLVTKGYYSFLDSDSNFGSDVLSLENIVTPTNKYVPLTGSHSIETGISGWIYDKRRLEDWDTLRTRYNSFLGGHDAGLRDGTSLTHWQTGTIKSMGYLDLAHYRDGDSTTWTPTVSTGSYAIHFDIRSLYSDYSFSSRIHRGNNLNGLNRLTLRDDTLHETLQVAIWERKDDYQIFKYRDFQYVEEFTGEIDTGTDTRKETTDSNGDILVDNLAGRKREFIVDGDELLLNGDHYISVGVASPPLVVGFDPAGNFISIWENKGEGQSHGRSVFGKYFPFETDSVRVVTEANEVITEWTEVANLNFSTPTDYHYMVDHDLGIITMGGYQAPDLLLSEEADADDIELSVYIDSATIAAYPEQGVIKIGDEYILYYGKTSSGFTDCVRGYDGTTASIHGKGSVIVDRRHGIGTTDTIYISYAAVPRVDYEVTSYDIRSANNSGWLDVRPSKNVETTDVFQMLSSEKNLAEVILETDSPLIGGNLYGPVFFGTDISRLTARGLDAAGNPVDDIPLTIEILSGSGSLNGFASQITANTNTLGEIYAFYNAPYSADDVELDVSSVTYDGADTLFNVPDLQASVDTQDAWIFQILKHDQVVGSTGLKLDVLSEDLTVAMPHGNTALTLDGILDTEDYDGGLIYVIGTDGVSRYREIANVWHDEDGSSRPVTVVGLAAPFPAGTSAGQTCRIYKFDEEQWNPSLKNGIRSILYEYTQEALHPITKLAGAYTPLHPDSISGTILRFSGRTLPMPDAIDNDVNLGDYVVIAPSEVLLQAYGRDPASGRIIRSNRIRLALDLPNFLTGVDSSGALPVPYGWTFATEEFNIGAGLGGANFITINPNATGINQFSLTGVF